MCGGLSVRAMMTGALKSMRNLKPKATQMPSKKARRTASKLHQEYGNRTDYGMGLELQIVTTQPVWQIHFEDEEPAKPAVPAQLAREARPARLVEKKL